jgi:TorA maturation chaperone TorD
MSVSLDQRREIGDLVHALDRALLPPELGSALGSVRRIWRGISAEDLASEHSRLFLGGGLVPLREGGYGDGLRFAGQPVDIADLSGFYQAFGFGPPPVAANPPDHLGTELEFMSLLHLKTAFALQRRRSEQVRITQAAMAHFVEDHLGRWTEAFEAALHGASAAPAYSSLAGLLRRAIVVECGRLGVRPAPAGRGTAADPMQSDTLICPLAERDRGQEPVVPIRNGKG